MRISRIGRVSSGTLMLSKPLCRWSNRHRPLLSRTLKTESVGRGFDPRQPHLTKTYHLGRRLTFRPLQPTIVIPRGRIGCPGRRRVRRGRRGRRPRLPIRRDVNPDLPAIFIPHECRRSRHPKFQGIATSSGAKHGGTGGRCAERSMHVGREWRRRWDGWKGFIR